ncbi:MAG: hypothetical protein R3E95_01550 [Thiolinea sp.]
MDPVSQAIVGSGLAQSVSRPRQLTKAAVLGGLSGMAADLDILIRPATIRCWPWNSTASSPMRYCSSRSVACCAPGCCMRCSAVSGPWISAGPTLWCIWSAMAATVCWTAAPATAPQLFWPFSNLRVSWDIVSIIDPLFTLPLIALVLLAATRKARRYALFAVLWGGIYLGLGYPQHQRAIAMVHDIAAARGHAPLSLEAKPSFANLLVWKVLYETAEDYHVLAVRPGWPGRRSWEGNHIAKLEVRRDLPWLDPGQPQACDIERFRWFSGGFIALTHSIPTV